MSLGGGGLILSHEVCCVVVNAAKLSKFWGPRRFGVGGWAFGWGVGGDKMCDLGKGVIKPEVKGGWGGESRSGRELQFSEEGRDVVPVRVFPVEASGRSLPERGAKHNCEGDVV